ncbi:hypothetical protein [Nocardia carnea]|uniref:Uncharacterized protein n=1 Tax=Nocardia carnea TaxID=37328 RepID=A0ABW7TSB6_9NOCA|nr:hypothetical protein [Nocardia carnea]
MADSLDEVWRTVRGMLDGAATDLAQGVSGYHVRARDGVAAMADRAGGADTDAAGLLQPTTTTRDPSSGNTTTARSSVYVPGRDLTDEVDYSALRRSGDDSLSGISPTFERIRRLQGFDGPVSVVSPQELEAAITAGGPRLFRGFEKDQYRDAFLAGPVRPGSGTTGFGTYATPLEAVALHYTDPTGRQGRATNSARVLRMALHPQAKTITLSALESDRHRASTEVSRQLRIERENPNRTDEDTARYNALLDKELVLADIGQYGALRGWDAIDAAGTFRNKEWNVLNPTALLVQRPA